MGCTIQCLLFKNYLLIFMNYSGYSKENKELLKFLYPQAGDAKKGKRNQVEKEEESQHHFIETKNKHSAIESNINEFEYRGLDRYADREHPHFRWYVGLGVCAYNLRKIGAQLIAQDRLDVQQEHLEKNGHKSSKYKDC